MAGWLDLIMKAAPAVASVAGSYAGNAAKGRAAEANLQGDQDRTRTSQYGTAQGAQMQAGSLDLARKQFEEMARGGRTKQAMLGDILANFTPTSINVPGIQQATIRGGAADSLGAMGKTAGAELSRQALLKLMEGDRFSGGDMLPQPGVTALPKAGMLEKIMGGIGVGGSMLGALGTARGTESGGESPSGGGESPTSWSNVMDIIKRLQTQNGGA